MTAPESETSSTNGRTQIADGTSLYYALLYLDDAAAQRAVDTLQFIDTIADTLLDVSEPQVAEKKIHWWHEELARLAKQSARHPAAVAVQTYLHGPAQLRDSLSVLSATSNERYTPLSDDAALHTALLEDYGSRLRLLEHALDVSSTKQINTAIASGLGQFHRLSNLVKGLRSGYAVFSDERYTKYALTPESLLTYSNSASSNNASSNSASSNSATATETQDTAHANKNIQALLAEAVAETGDALAGAVNELANASAITATALPVNILCHIRLAQVRLWQKQKTDLLRESMNLTPLRKFFIAYRCKRRYAKLK